MLFCKKKKGYGGKKKLLNAGSSLPCGQSYTHFCFSGFLPVLEGPLLPPSHYCAQFLLHSLLGKKFTAVLGIWLDILTRSGSWIRIQLPKATYINQKRGFFHINIFSILAFQQILIKKTFGKNYL
jgi:hypothetical protein